MQTVKITVCKTNQYIKFVLFPLAPDKEILNNSV